MLKEKEAVVRKALILYDAFIVSIAFLLSYILRQHFHKIYKFDLMPSTHVVSDTIASLSDYLIVLILSVLLWCMMLYFNGMYRSMRTRNLFEVVWIIIKSSFFTTFSFGAFIFLFKLTFVSRIFFAIFMLISSIAILLEKIVIFLIMHKLRKLGHNFRRLLVVGIGKRAAILIDKINDHPEWGFKIIGVINDDSSREVKKVKETFVIGTLENLTEILHMHAIDQVIFVVPRSRLSHVENAVQACELEGIKATIAVDLFDLDIARLNLTDLDGIPLITFETICAKEWELFVKRGVDIVLSGLGIIILSPLLLIVSVLVKITSPGPALFSQQRVGLNGRKFILYKFRTMYKGADKNQSELEALNEMEGPVFKIKKDPRITPVGRILRKFSVDELPQLFNVFAGHMSLVGPRPPIHKEVAQYKSWQRRRLSMRPGITCLWQIRGRNKIGFEEWMKLDLEYLDNWSLFLDFKILIKTIPVVLFGDGAY